MAHLVAHQPHTIVKETSTGMGTEPQPHLSVVPRPVPARHLYRVPEAMQLLSMSRSVLYEQIRAGRLRSVSQGRTRLIPASAIQDYVSLLITESEVSYGQPA